MTDLCDIKGLSVNVRGLNKSALKRGAVFRWLHHQNSSFIFLQQNGEAKLSLITVQIIANGL